MELLEENLGKKAIKTFLPMQQGDVEITWADTLDLEKDIGYTPKIKLEEGIAHFVNWFKSYHSK